MKYGKGYWKYAIIAWATVFVEVVCEILIPFLSQYIIHYIWDLNAVTKTYTDPLSTNLTLTSSLMGVLAVISCTCGIAAGFAASKAAAGFSKNLRQAMYYKVQEFSFANIDRFSTASLVTRMTTDVSNVTFALQMILRMVVRAPMMMIVAFVMAILLSWQLSLIFVVLIPFLGFFLFFISAKVHPTFVKVFNAYDDLNASVEENLNGIRVVKSFGREDFEKEKFGHVSYFIYKNFVKAEKMLAFNDPLMQFSIYAAMIVIGFFGAQLIVASAGVPDGFDAGSLTSFISYVMMIFNSLMFVSMGFVMVIISRNSAERIAEVLIETPSIANKKNPVMEVKDGQVDFDRVSFRYNQKSEKEVLSDIDVHIPSGSVVGIIGSTGSSKSSFVNLIARLYDVNEGSVKVGGVDVRDYDIATLRDSVAVVLQKNVLFSGTIRSNLLWGNPNATQEQIEHAAHIACADEFINKMPKGYDSVIEQGGTNVSGGQRQRLCIARALLKSPKILILDDSTSAVDTHTDSLIRESFRTEIPDVTKFIVSQRVLSIKDADTILVLHEGKIIAQGNNDELMENSSVYRELYETQLGGGDFDGE
ncbi:MAG: ABC transporter ATP-binding protein/permease [Bacilli bacterium]|nr:ABC transporter ATP-binding protein/permease [Bacilli bacterium]